MFRFFGNTGSFGNIVSIAVAMAGVALGLGLLFGTGNTVDSLLLWFVPAIALSAWYGDLKTGLLTTAVAVAIAYCCWLNPGLAIPTGLLRSDWGAAVAGVINSQAVRFGLFVLTGGLISLLVSHVAPTAAATNAEIFQAIANSNDGFYLLNRQWQVRYVNAQGAAYLRQTPADLLGKQIEQVQAALADAALVESLQRSIDTDLPTQFELFCQSCSVWLEIQAYPTANGITVLAHDITPRKQIEAERDQLLRREQAMRTTAEMAEQRSAFLAEVSKLLHASLDIASIGAAAQAIVPFLAEGCLIFALEEGRLQPIAVAAADAAQQSQLEAFAVRHPPRSPINLIQLLPDDAEQDLCAALFDRDAAAIAACQAIAPQSLLLPLIVQDRTLGLMQLVRSSAYTAAEIALAEELARRTAIAIDHVQLYRQAETLNRLKDEFLSTLSHELRTPLNVISGWTQLLQARNYDEMTNQAIATIGHNADLQAQIIDELLDASQVITGRIQLQPVPAALDAIVRDVITALQPTAAAKAIDLRYSSEAIVPLSLDPRYIRQAVWNLIGNAIKFTSQGGRVTVTLEVSGVGEQGSANHQPPAANRQPSVSPSQSTPDIASASAAQHSTPDTRHPTPFVCLTVSDTGKGISPDFLPYVFDRFRQEDGSTTRNHGGLGLGLAIVRHIAELHGGTIQAESAGVGQGATFTLRLPLMAR